MKDKEVFVEVLIRNNDNYNEIVRVCRRTLMESEVDNLLEVLGQESAEMNCYVDECFYLKKEKKHKKGKLDEDFVCTKDNYLRGK